MEPEKAIELFEEMKKGVYLFNPDELYDYVIKTIKKSIWIPVSEPPKEDGKYLVTLKYTKSITRIDVLSYSHNLYSIDKFDFADEKRPGWYEYNNECGYYEVNNVVAWMPLPEAYKEVKDE